MRLTFVDAGVLIAAARGGTEQASRAMAVLDDSDRVFAASPFLRLEVLPQALFNKRHAEVAFYEAFFTGVSTWAMDLPAIVEAALREAATYGVEAMDALHVAAAASALPSSSRPRRRRARSTAPGRCGSPRFILNGPEC